MHAFLGELVEVGRDEILAPLKKPAWEANRKTALFYFFLEMLRKWVS